jgi:hypothetical protein
MDIVLGVILYIAVVGGFVAFGKFLKKCDVDMKGQIEPGDDINDLFL